jgi:PAS domain S-box-containing protein
MDLMTVDERVRGGPPVAPNGYQHVDPIEVAFGKLVDRHPLSVIGAISGLASPKLVPVPDSVPVGRDRVGAVGTLFDLVVPADQVIMAKLWGQVRTQGAVVAPLRLQSHPERQGVLSLFDLRRRHGVIMVAFVEGPSEDHLVGGGTPLAVLPPRFARASKDVSAILRSADPALSSMLGCTPEALIGKRLVDLVHPDDQELGVGAWMEMLESPGQARRIRLRHRHADGTWIWLEITNHNRLSDPDHADVMTEMMDISEEVAAHDALRAREQLLAQLTETVPMGLFHTDLRGVMLFANRRLHEITGTVKATTLEEQLGAVLAADRPRVDEAMRAATAGTETTVEISIRAAGQVVRHCTMSIRPLTDDVGTVTGLTGCVGDVTDMVETLEP